MNILLAGCSGLIGTALDRALRERGHQTTQLVRPGSRPTSGARVWDPERGQLDPALVEATDAVVFLGGENVAGRLWTPAVKTKILESRVQGTQLISKTIAQVKGPRVFLCASAIGFYGEGGSQLFTEMDGPGSDFLSKVVRSWEEATRPAGEHGCRVVNTRIGIVLSPEGGALSKMLGPFRWGLGGRLGTGSQYMSWISLEDVVAAMALCIESDMVRGPVNLVAPQPVTNADFTKTLAKSLHRPALAPVPRWAISLALGEMGRSLLLSSTRVSCARLEGYGFTFAHPTLQLAFSHLFSN